MMHLRRFASRERNLLLVGGVRLLGILLAACLNISKSPRSRDRLKSQEFNLLASSCTKILLHTSFTPEAPHHKVADFTSMCIIL